MKIYEVLASYIGVNCISVYVHIVHVPKYPSHYSFLCLFVSLCLLCVPVSQVWLVVDVVLGDKDDPHPLLLSLRVNKLCVLKILLAVIALALDLSLLSTNLYER